MSMIRRGLKELEFVNELSTIIHKINRQECIGRI